MMTVTANTTGARREEDSRRPLDLAGQRVHFVGIGGCGMSGLARLVQRAGAVCTGSDLAAGDTVAALRGDGFVVSLEQTAASVPADCDMLVISAAVKGEHPEVVEARRRGLPVFKYAQMLGRLMLGRRGVAVAGTHGKSTTTSMLSHLLIQAGLDPSFIVGAHCAQIGGGSRSGAGDLLIAEACEYDRSFHNFHPTHAIILNVEVDHLDLYRNLDEIVEAFAVFARRLPRDGSLLIQHEMPHRLAITAELDCAVQTIGFAPQADWRVSVNGQGPARVKLLHAGEPVAQWTNPMPGEHMAYNAAAAAVTAHRLGATWEAIISAIESFRGLDRRMQLVGAKGPGDRGGQKPESGSESGAGRGGVAAASEGAADRLGHGPSAVHHGSSSILIVDDYGHHPTEIDTTLRALRRHYNPRRLICVFQPHQHSRTRFLMNEFAASFSEADVVIVPHIYFVRDSEQERHAVTAGDLVDRLRQRGVTAMHLHPFEAIVEQLQQTAQPGDLVVTMGAGDVWKIARDFLTC